MTLEDSFDMVCACMVLISCLNFWFVREPKIKIPKQNLNSVADSDVYTEQTEQDQDLRLSPCEKIKFLTNQVLQTVKSDMRYSLCFASWVSTSLVPLLASTFLMLYISHFAKIGVLADDKEAKALYSRLSGVSYAVSALLLPFIGKVADIIPLKLLFPFVFLARAAFCFALRYVEDPSQQYCQATIGGVFVISVIQYIMV